MKIKELLTDESKWTKEVNARDSRGVPIDPNSDGASCFCIIGAIFKCYPDPQEHNDVYDKIKAEVTSRYPTPFLSDWNDHEATFEQIREVLEKVDV